ncbi:MAG: T9SS type A sorting domain-containing protein [Bacteroidales bacterium]|nr:T9SS type A sorting domain-containing protein [Bacteroidales bacterium]
MKKPVIFFTLFRASVLLKAQMSGDYTVCEDLSCDFESITEAITTLESEGMNGPVSILLTDTLYEEQVTIPYIEGSGIQNPLYIKRAGSLSPGELIVITYTASGTEDNYVFQFDSAQYVALQDVTVEAGGDTYATCILMQNGCHGIAIENAEMISYNGSTSNVIHVDDPDADSIAVISCAVRYGGTGLGIYGLTGNNVEYIKVVNNEFIQNLDKGIYGYKTMYSMFEDNVFYNTGTGSTYIGIEFGNAFSYSIENNYFNLKTGKGMDIGYSGGNYENTVANNIIYIEGDGTTSIDYGIQTRNGSYQDFYYNSVVIGEFSSGSSAALNIPVASGFGTNNTFLNNNLVNFATGYVVQYLDEDELIIGEFDYNNLYTETGIFANYYGSDIDSLAQWQDSTGFDMNSVCVDPGFVDENFIIACSEDLQNAGTPVRVDSDYYDVPRDAVTPDIGALENEPIDLEFEEDTMYLCDVASVEINGGSFDGVDYSWSTGSDEQQITVTEAGTYSLTVTGSCYSSIDSVLVSDDCGVSFENIDIDPMTISPNPANTYFTISVEEGAVLKMQIISVDGKTMFTGELNDKKYRIDCSDWPAGLYIIRANYDDKVHFIKLIKN